MDNKTKCKHFHLGKQYNSKYTMEGEEITKTSEEKDLSITIDNQLICQKHIEIQVKKANQN